jgi:hypothetical protein
MEAEIKTVLDGMKSNLEQKMAGLDAQIEAKATALLQGAEAKMKEANEAEIKSIKDEFDNRLNTIVAEMKAKQAKTEVKTFAGEFAQTIEQKHNEIKEVSKGRSVSFEMKDLTINTNNSITGGLANEAGGAVIRQGDGIILPSPLVNFAQLVATVAGSEDTIRIWRESAEANAFARQTDKTASKAEQDLSTPPVVFTATYLAGLYRYHKSMMRNLPWMQNRLPQMLRRNYFKAENAGFYAALYAAATAYAGSATGIDALVEAIGQLEGSDFAPNGIVINPADWAQLSITKDDENGYTLPSTVAFVNGQLTVNGVPVFKATFVAPGEFIVGDWSQAYKYVTDGLKVEFFEQDVDNVEKNAITVRVEESNVLVIEQPLAFIKGNVFTSPSV